MSSLIKQIGFILTRKCTAECSHCGSDASPDKEGVIPMPLIIDFLGLIRGMNLEVYYITGGEPFLYYPVLKEILRIGQEKNLKAVICTNAFWATSQDEAINKLLKLKESGLHLLKLSTDVFHLKKIPLVRILNAAHAASMLEIACEISIPSLKNDWMAITLYTRLCQETTGKVVLETIHPLGRGEHLPADRMIPQVQKIENCPYMGLIELGVNGDVSCCPAGADFPPPTLMVRNVKDYQNPQVLMNKFNFVPLYHILQTFGPLGLYYLLYSCSDKFSKTKQNSLHPCHLCRSLTGDQTNSKQLKIRHGIDLLSEANPESIEVQIKNLGKIIHEAEKQYAL